MKTSSTLHSFSMAVLAFKYRDFLQFRQIFHYNVKTRPNIANPSSDEVTVKWLASLCDDEAFMTSFSLCTL